MFILFSRAETLRRFGRGYYEEHFCIINSKLDWWFRVRCHFKMAQKKFDWRKWWRKEKNPSANPEVPIVFVCYFGNMITAALRHADFPLDLARCNCSLKSVLIYIVSCSYVKNLYIHYSGTVGVALCRRNCHVEPCKIEDCFRTLLKFKLIKPHIFI